LLVNPEISWHSGEVQIVWDDCMRLPEIAVKVQRWRSISVKYQNLLGEVQMLENCHLLILSYCSMVLITWTEF